jgi:formylglycine-generating enzyme required for sulfatase activity
MVMLPAGTLIPLFATGARKPGDTPAAVSVSAFWLDATPVTNAQFAQFVRTAPRWQRSQIKRVFAEQAYLSHWASDTAPGSTEAPDAPVTRVSWFAAKAYCAAQGKVLPTTDQWEYAAAASATAMDGSTDPVFLQTILDWYGKPNPAHLPSVGQGFRNGWGVYDLHGLVWEWTVDFNTAMTTGDPRDDGDLDRKLFCGAGASGASNFRDYAAFLRYGFRSSLKADYALGNLGFRCAASP